MMLAVSLASVFGAVAGRILASTVASAAFGGLSSDPAASWWWNFNVSQEVCPASYPERSGGSVATIRRASADDELPQTLSDGRGEVAYCTDGSSSKMFMGVDVTGSVPLFGQNAVGTGISGRSIQVSDIGSRLLKNVDGKMPSFTVEIVCRQPAIDGRIAENRLLYLWGNDFSLGIEKFCWGGNGGWPYGWGLHGVRGSNWNYISKNDANVALFPEDGKWHHVALVYDAANETVAVFTDYQQKVQVKIDSPFGGTENIWYLEVANGNTSRGPQLLTVDELKVTAAALGTSDFLRTTKVNPMDFDFSFKADSGAVFFPTDVRGNAALVGSTMTARSVFPGTAVSDGLKSELVASAASFSNTDCRLEDAVLHGQSAFTLEAFLSASSGGSVFSCGADWSLAISDGRLVWRHGGAESVLAAVEPNTWHGIALRYEPKGDAAAYSVFLDGVSAGTVADTAQLTFPTSNALSLGSGLTAQVGRFRAAPVALPAEALLRTASWWWNFNVGQEASPASYPELSGGSAASIRRPANEEELPRTLAESRGNVVYRTDGSTCAFSAGVDVTGSVPLFGQNAANTGISGRSITVQNVGNGLLRNVDGKIPSFTVEIVCKQEPVNGQIAGNKLLYLYGNDFNVRIEKFCWGSDGGWPYGWGLKSDRPDLGRWNYIDKCSTDVAIFPEDGKWHHVALVYDAENLTVTVFTDYQQKVLVKIDSPFGGTENIWNLDIADGNTSRGPQQLTVDELKVTAAALNTSDFLRTAKVNPMDFDFDFATSSGQEAFVPVDARGNVTLSGGALTAKSVSPGVYVADGQRSEFVTYAAVLPSADCRLEGADLLAQSAFTLEAVLNATSDGAIFSCGSDWSLALSDGHLVWRHGGAESVLATVMPNAWHAIALCYEPKGESAAYSVFVDGVSAGAVADAVPLAYPTTSPLALGGGLAAVVKKFRSTPELLPETALLRAAPDDGYDTAYAYWSLDGTAGAAVVEAPAANGEKSFKLFGMSALENWSQEAGGLTPPRFSDFVPGSCIWDARSGRVINPENETSVCFTNTMSEAGGAAGDASHRGGSLLRTSGCLEMPAVFTVEFFYRAQRPLAYSCIVGQGNGDGGWLWDFCSWWNTWDRAFRVNLDSEKMFYLQGPSADGPFNHVAIVVNQSDPNKTKVRVHLNYGAPTEAEWNVGRKLSPGMAAELWLGAAGFSGNAFDGWIDELRVTAGELSPEHFMRVFKPRTDMTSVWFAFGADGAERMSDGGVAYLTATFDWQDVVTDDEPPFPGGAAYRMGQEKVEVLNSVRFTGGKGATIPCAAVTGTKDFTLEATVKGFSGEIASKTSRAGSSWAFGIKPDGRAYLAVNGEEVVSDAVVDAGKWSHVALVVDRQSDQTATLFVDRVRVATASAADMQLDGGDVRVGLGAVGKLAALRFSPSALVPKAFFVARANSGFVLFVGSCDAAPLPAPEMRPLPEMEALFPRGDEPSTMRPDGTIDFYKEDRLDVPRSPVGNLLPNGSFEQGLSGWSYDYWCVSWNAVAREGGKPLEEVVTGGRFGALALKFRALETAGVAEELLSPPLSAATGVTHVVSFWARGRARAWAQIRVMSAASGLGTVVGQPIRIDATEQWKRYEATFVPSRAGVVVGVSGGGDVLVDGISVERGDRTGDVCVPPVEGRLETADVFNCLDPRQAAKMRLVLSADSPVKGTVRVSVRNFYRETVFDRLFEFNHPGRSCLRTIELGPDSDRLATGTYVVKTDYAVGNISWTAPYQRFTVMKPLDGKQATACFHGVFPAFDRSSRGEELAQLMVASGLMGFCWGSNAMLAQGETATLRRKYGLKNRLHTLYTELSDRYPAEFGWGCPGFGTYTNVSPEKVAFIEAEAYRAGLVCAEDDTRWALFNEDECNQPLVMAERYEDWFAYQHACWRGLNRAFEERGLRLQYAPTHGTAMYQAGHPGRKAMEGYLKTALDHGFRYDFVAVHTYNGLDLSELGSSDRDEYVPHIRGLLEKYGYPETTPIEFSEGFNVLPFRIRAWNAQSGDNFSRSCPTLDVGLREFVHAAALARMHIMDLKYYPILDFTHGWQKNLTADARLSQYSWVKAVNTLGHLLPNPQFAGDVRNAKRRWRAYSFRQGQDAVTAMWVADREVELGWKPGPVVDVRLPQDVRFVDLMGEARRAQAQPDGSFRIPLTPAPLFIVTRNEPEEVLAELRRSAESNE